jgi:hypothetical protein
VQHAEFVEAGGALLELDAVGHGECDVVQPDVVLAEGLDGGGGPVLVQADSVPLPMTQTVWCKSGSVSSSITGPVPKRDSYQGALTLRSRTVRPMWWRGRNAVMSMLASVE